MLHLNYMVTITNTTDVSATMKPIQRQRQPAQCRIHCVPKLYPLLWIWITVERCS